MQAQDSTTLFLLKLWPWFEANRNRLIAGGVIAVIAIFILWYVACQHESKEIAAGQALTQVALSGGAQLAEACLKISEQYPGTIAAQRALMQSAAALFVAGKYSDAQTRFQKYLDAHPDADFSGQALLGVAASLDAQGKADLAASAYQRIIGNVSDAVVVSAAKFGLARMEESQGKLNDALVLYQEIASANAGTSLGSEAAMRLMEIRSKQPVAPAPAPAPAAPLKPAK
jgi:predicted negative regulator of RcsB-dependent stress response